MVTKVITDYLDDPSKDLNKKYEFIKGLDLPYSDVFMLIELYKWDYNIYHMLCPFVSYHDSKLDYKIRKERKESIELKRRKKPRKLRSGKKYDQY